MRSATSAPVNPRKHSERDAEKIKRRNRSIGKCEACRSDRFITPWTHRNSFVAMHDATAAAESSKKFHIFHEWQVWKSPHVIKCCSSAEDSMIAASHPEQKSRVMRKAIRQSVYNRRGRQTDPEETATDFLIAHYPLNFIQRVRRHFGVCVQKPQNITASYACPCVHLRSSSRLRVYNAIAQGHRQFRSAVAAAAVGDNDFRLRSSVAQMPEKRLDQRSLI